ncbi:MAG: tRNA1(Val) (adenine(37)-N6)-methyltransferase [Proteobacteria bacterium]|nr:tRNA1(Val) (adenine(37)-N6)-methyltransferase [Pseudomonadota bacterium]
MVKNDEAIEDLLKGNLKVIQKKGGYRFSIDAVLLADFTRVKKKDVIADLGTGCGLIPLILSRKAMQSRICGIELDAAAAEMAARSIRLNKLSEKISIAQADVRAIRALYTAESFDLVTTNPPYGRPDSGRINPTKEVAEARHEIAGSLDDFLAAAVYLLKYGGRLSLVYPARRLADLMEGLRKRGIEPKRLRTVHSRLGEGAKLVLLEGIKGGGVEMEVMRPLYIYDNNGEYTDEVEAMYS